MKTTFLRKHWDALLASVAACVFVYLFTRMSGIGISPDSVHYESTATHIRNHFVFTDFNDEPLVNFPLGYPSFLALISFITQQSVLAVAPVVNACLISGVIILTSILMANFQQPSRWYKAAILSLIACSPCLMEIYAMLWSETLFLFLSLLCLVSIQHYNRLQNMRALLFAALCVAWACATRYVGVILLCTGLYFIFFNGSIPKAKKIKHLLVFATVGISLVMMNLVRNKIIAGHSTGVREKSLRTLSDSFQQAGNVLTEWMPFLHNTTLATLLFIGVLILGICLGVYRLLQQQYFTSAENVVAVFFTGYALFIILIATLSRFEDLSGRLLSPLYIPLLLTATSWMIGWTRRLLRIQKTIVVFVLLIVFASFHYHHYRLNAEAWEGIKDSGMPGYREGSWRESAAVAMVRTNKHKVLQPVYANANDAVYFLTGIHSAPLPHKEIQGEIDELLRHSSFTVIWFVDGENSDLVNIDFIKQHKRLLSVIEAENGAIYFFGD